MRTRTTTITTLAMAAMLLSGCAGATTGTGSAGSAGSGAPSASAEASTGGGDPCAVIKADVQSAVIFSSIIPEMTTAEQIRGRADVMDAITDVPADLDADWDAWRGLLEEAATGSEVEDYSWFPVDPEVKESGSRLFDWYSETCL